MGYRRNGHIEPKLQWAINTQKDQIADRLQKVDNNNFAIEGIDTNLANRQPSGIYHTARAIKIFKDKYGRYPNTKQEYDRFIPEYTKMLSNGENKAEELERAVHRLTMLHDVQGHLEKSQDPGEFNKQLDAAQTRFMVTLPSSMQTDLSSFAPTSYNPDYTHGIESLNAQIDPTDKTGSAQNSSLTKFKKQILGLEPPDDLNSYLPDFEIDWDMKKWNKKN